MVIVTKSTYPPQSAKAMGKLFLEAQPLPDYIVRHGPFITPDNTEGIIALSVFDLDNSKLADGILAVANFFAFFFDVPGFTYSIRIHTEPAESLKMIGLA